MKISKYFLIGCLAITLLFGVIWFSGGNSDFDELTHAEHEIGLELDSQMVNVGAVTLHVVFAGPVDAEPVVLIHGFPQFWYMWRKHIAALVEAGYRVAVPDLRGYNRSEKPAGRAAYEFSDYADDIVGLLNSQGWDQANIVGHDIGARVSWELVFMHSERISRAVIVSAGHPYAFANSGAKADVSWYRTFLQLPIVPEMFSRVGGLSFLANSLRSSSRTGTFSDTDLELYTAAWDREHAFDSMIGVYSNFSVQIESIPEDGRPEVPVLFMYGAHDSFISGDIAERTKDYLGADHVKIYPNLSHWLLEEEPDKTAEHIIAFFN